MTEAAAPRRMSTKLITLISVVLVLALVAGGIGVVFFSKGAGPRNAARDYLSAVSRGDDAAAAEMCIGVDAAGAAEFAQSVRMNGVFEGTTFTEVIVRNDQASVAGTATFSHGTSRVEARLARENGQWKVQNMRVSLAQ